MRDEAPTILCNEEPGQVIMGDAFGDCGLEPRSVEQIHGIDERVSLRSVVESAQVLGLFVRDWCGLVPGRKEEN